MSAEDGNGHRTRPITDEQIAMGQVREALREVSLISEFVRDELRPAMRELKFQFAELCREVTAKDEVNAREIAALKAKVAEVEGMVDAVAAVAAAR